MKALTLIQPWAQLIADGRKKIETYSWNTRYRGSLAIHAGQKLSLIEAGQWYRAFADGFYVFPFGAIIAIVQLVDTFRMTETIITNTEAEERNYGDWRPGRFGWILTNVRKIEPIIGVRGSLGLWNWEKHDASV